MMYTIWAIYYPPTIKKNTDKSMPVLHDDEFEFEYIFIYSRVLKNRGDIFENASPNRRN